MGEILIALDGVNGQIDLYESKIVIHRKGINAKLTMGFFKGDKEIYISQISGIQMKLGTGLTNGYIQFTIPGGNESTKGLAAATKDENSVFFRKKDNETAQRLKSKIEELKSASSSSQVISALSPADEIKKYKSLLDDGTITQEEFAAKKKQLLEI
jgi:hypothetical protein